VFAFIACTAILAADPYASAPPYAIPIAPGTTLTPLFTVGQQIPLTGGGPEDLYRILGIPDGMGATWLDQGARTIDLTLNHEFYQDRGLPFGTLPSGARISRLVLSVRKVGGQRIARATSGKLAFDRVFDGETGIEIDPTAGISRLCSANVADQKFGFDRRIHLTGEEATSPESFDGRGGMAFAAFEGAAYTLPRLGRLSFENALVAPFSGSKTVVFALEDGPVLGSQLYMYVGSKVPGGADALSINGLDNGSLYVFAGDNAALNSEQSFHTKGQTTTGHWAPVSHDGTDVDLQNESVASGSFLFSRIEDGTFDKARRGVLYFATTGGSTAPGNPFGKLYRLDFDPRNPLGTATLTILLDGSEGIVNPDNLDINRRGELMILEDPTYDLSLPPLNLSRDTYIWGYDTATAALTAVAEMDRDAAIAHALAADPLNTDEGSVPGDWEFSGIIDAEAFLGRGSWLFTAQAHSLRINPVGETIEGGQVLQLVWIP
jgi:hypothetical protein